MGDYANVKTKNFKNLLRWLGNHNEDIEIKKGGNHNTKVKYQEDSYPIPTSHPSINKHIVKHFMEWLVKKKICTKEEFDSKL